MKLAAQEVYIDEDELTAEVTFVFADETRGWDSLAFERPWLGIATSQGTHSVWVGRRFPIYSGCAGIERFEFHRTRISVLFSPALAAKLQMDQDLSMSFDLDDACFNELRNALRRVFEGEPYFLEDQAIAQLDSLTR